MYSSGRPPTTSGAIPTDGNRIEPLGHVLFMAFHVGVSQEWREGIGFTGRRGKQDNDQQDDSFHGGSNFERDGPTGSETSRLRDAA